MFIVVLLMSASYANGKDWQSLPRARSPQLALRLAVEHLGDAAAGGGRHIGWQRVGWERTLLEDLEARLRYGRLPPLAHHVEGHMIARKNREVGVDAEQLRRTRQHHAGFLGELARQRLDDPLAPLDPTTREVPAPLIAVADQQP